MGVSGKERKQRRGAARERKHKEQRKSREADKRGGLEKKEIKLRTEGEERRRVPTREKRTKNSGRVNMKRWHAETRRMKRRKKDWR